MNILLLDDDAGSLAGMQTAIEMLGHTCDAYTDPLKAMRDCLTPGYIENYDAVITDFSMPNIDGLGFAGLVHFLAPKLKVVIVSGLVSEEIAQEVRRRGLGTFLYKPVSADELSAALQN